MVAGGWLCWRAPLPTPAMSRAGPAPLRPPLPAAIPHLPSHPPRPRPAPASYPDGSGRWALYRLPHSTKAVGTCIFIHGCKHDPMSWFYRSDSCTDCTGAHYVPTTCFEKASLPSSPATGGACAALVLQSADAAPPVAPPTMPQACRRRWRTPSSAWHAATLWSPS